MKKAVRAMLQADGQTVIDQAGRFYEFLGSGKRYGFDSQYAVRLSGEINATPLPCYSMPWPFTQDEVAIETES